RDTLGEFKTMVRTLHEAGLEVILDVVYNHTGEGDHGGPTLAFRGLDNSIYYRLDPSNPRRYLNFTGTGNSFNTSHRVVLALVMDSLRYWVQEMHVDGFRFDLAPTLARTSASTTRPTWRRIATAATTTAAGTAGWKVPLPILKSGAVEKRTSATCSPRSCSRRGRR